MELVKRTINIEDHLGIETGPLEAEMVSLSGRHADLAEGTFNLSVNFSPLGHRDSNIHIPG